MRAGWLLTAPAAPQSDGYLFDDLVLRFLEEVTAKKRHTKRDHWSAKALFPTFSGRLLEGIRGADVRAYIAKRREEVAPGTVNKEVGLMSAAINWARHELEWDIPNPWQARRLREPAGRNRWLTPEEAERLLGVAQRRSDRWPWLRDFILLGLYAGLRPGEITGLGWLRVDFERDRIVFHEGDQKNGKLGAVPLNGEARQALLARDQFRRTWCGNSPWVFARRDGTRIASVKKGFMSCAKDAGLEDLHPHDLRRTFGSWLVQAGVGIERVSKLMRHGDVAITDQVYAHLRPSDLADAVAVLGPLSPELSRQTFTPPAKPAEEGK